MNSGNIDPVALLQIEYLIVDEFQDLNPMDLDFVDGLVTAGSNVFIAGDPIGLRLDLRLRFRQGFIQFCRSAAKTLQLHCTDHAFHTQCVLHLAKVEQ